jgi:hypothetical protein
MQSRPIMRGGATLRLPNVITKITNLDKLILLQDPVRSLLLQLSSFLDVLVRALTFPCGSVCPTISGHPRAMHADIVSGALFCVSPNIQLNARLTNHH